MLPSCLCACTTKSCSSCSASGIGAAASSYRCRKWLFIEVENREVRYESSALLRWSRHAAQRIRRRCPQTHGADWDTADSLAPDEVLRPLRTQGLHSLPRIQGERHQGLLLE